MGIAIGHLFVHVF